MTMKRKAACQAAGFEEAALSGILKATLVLKAKTNPDLPFLAFLEFLAFFSCKEFLVFFFECLSLLSQGF